MWNTSYSLSVLSHRCFILWKKEPQMTKDPKASVSGGSSWHWDLLVFKLNYMSICPYLHLEEERQRWCPGTPKQHIPAYYLWIAWKARRLQGWPFQPTKHTFHPLVSTERFTFSQLCFTLKSESQTPSTYPMTEEELLNPLFRESSSGDFLISSGKYNPGRPSLNTALQVFKKCLNHKVSPIKTHSVFLIQKRRIRKLLEGVRGTWDYKMEAGTKMNLARFLQWWCERLKSLSQINNHYWSKLLRKIKFLKISRTQQLYECLFKKIH